MADFDDAMHSNQIDGFRFGGLACGIKQSGKPDLALLLADEPVAAAAVFTRNQVRAAPVVLSEGRVKSGRSRGVLINAGNANACTGEGGFAAAQRMSEVVAAAAGIGAEELLVASTGVIGVPLPVQKIEAAAERLVAATQHSGFDAFAHAILTTDKGPKIARAEVTLPAPNGAPNGGVKVRLLGCCKGAGMIAPNMATTLAFACTDAAADPAWLKGVLQEAAARTFNEISVDGDTSTNDSLFLFASGRAKNSILRGDDEAGLAFGAALTALLDDLARQIVRDGEGATRVVTIEVSGAPDEAAAVRVARRVGASPLVKTAIFGADPNWGRILCAVGNAGVEFDPARVEVAIDEVAIVKAGIGVGGVEEAAHQAMKRPAYAIRIDLHAGQGRGRHVTCDLTHEYVTINADYRT